MVTATAPGVVSGLITLTGNNTIDANSSATYIVVIRNMPVLQTSNSQDWSVSLKEVTANGISATNYINVGNGLPITYVK